MFNRKREKIVIFPYSSVERKRVVVAEWLRRWTRNPLGSPRAGSNPADYDSKYFFCHTSQCNLCCKMTLGVLVSSFLNHESAIMPQGDAALRGK